MTAHVDIRDSALRKAIRENNICFAGNKKLKIYGTLGCRSGKRMKIENRVFFHSEKEAIENGFRPCAHCMNENYKTWKMELLTNIEATTNLLPYDGEVNYFGKVLDQKQTQHYLDRLLNTIEWKHDEAVIFGRHIITKRKVAWYGDEDFSYTYSNITKEALKWTKELRELKQLTEELSGVTYNSCLLNLYHDGNEGMSWHSDDEVMLEKDSAIASFSFGAERKFSLKNRQTKETISLALESGSLLLMKGTTQTYWMHSLPKSKKITQPRVNLTFRKMVR